MKTATTTTLRLPRKHAEDWLDRCGDGYGARLVSVTARTIILELSPTALTDLTADAEFYAECMGPVDTGDIDYRPAARRCLAAIHRQSLD